MIHTVQLSSNIHKFQFLGEFFSFWANHSRNAHKLLILTWMYHLDHLDIIPFSLDDEDEEKLILSRLIS